MHIFLVFASEIYSYEHTLFQLSLRFATADEFILYILLIIIILLLHYFIFILCVVAAEAALTHFTFQGGESNNIEESTVMSLFASGYETKVKTTGVLCRNISNIRIRKKHNIMMSMMILNDYKKLIE